MTNELLIFGAYGALGRGAASILMKKNYTRVFLFDRNIDNDPYAAENTENIAVGNLSNEEDVKKAFQSIEPSKDKKFYLFSTIGGYWGGKAVWETPAEEWDKMFEMNLKSNFLIAKYFSQIVRESAGGSICFTAAITALRPQRERAAYDASKSALISLVKTLALESSDFKLSANAIAPFIIDTPSNRKWMPDSDNKKWSKPEEIGKLVDSIFFNFNTVTGNVFELTKRFETD